MFDSEPVGLDPRLRLRAVYSPPVRFQLVIFVIAFSPVTHSVVLRLACGHDASGPTLSPGGLRRQALVARPSASWHRLFLVSGPRTPTCRNRPTFSMHGNKGGSPPSGSNRDSHSALAQRRVPADDSIRVLDQVFLARRLTSLVHARTPRISSSGSELRRAPLRKRGLLSKRSSRLS